MTEATSLRVRMSIVVEGVLGEKDYSFPDDFVPPFLSTKVEAPVTIEPPVEEPDSPEVMECSTEAPVVVIEDTEETSIVAQPLGQIVVAAATPGKAAPAIIRGMYTTLFTLLGMLGAAFAYLKDNLDQLTDIKWQTIAIVMGGAVLAGLGYGLKKYWKPDGLL
jgi:hypothetical protein